MGSQILLGNRVCPYDHIQTVFLFDKTGEVLDPRTWWIANDKSGCKVDYLRSIFLHLLRYIFYIPARTAVAGSKTNKFHLFTFVPLERTLAVLQRPQAFSARTGAIPVADDYSDFLNFIVRNITTS